MTKTKKIKPAFIVDLTDATCVEDVRFAFTSAKILAGLPIAVGEYERFVRDIINLTLEVAYTHSVKPTVIKDDKVVAEEKKPWYKRFWNWIRRK